MTQKPDLFACGLDCSSAQTTRTATCFKGDQWTPQCRSQKGLDPSRPIFDFRLDSCDADDNNGFAALS